MYETYDHQFRTHTSIDPIRVKSQNDLNDFSDVWSLAIEGSGTGIWDRNLVTDEIRYSSSWFAILGYDVEPSSNNIEISYSRVHPDDLAFVRRRLDDHLAGLTQVYEVEHRLRAKNGSYKWVLSRGRIIARAADGTALRMAGTTVDITKTRELATLIQEQTDALAAAHRLAKIGSWYWELDGKSISLSLELLTMMGRPHDDTPISYEQLRTIIHPNDYLKTMDTYNRAIKDQVAVTAEYRIVLEDGSCRETLTYAEPVFDFGDRRVIGLRGTSQDITAVRSIEAQLRASEDHYRHMVDLHPQIPWTADPDGNILDTGVKWFQLTGMTPDETFPNGWTKAVHPEDLSTLLVEWENCLAKRVPLDIEYRLRHKSGDFLWVRVRAAVRLDGQGQPVRWYGTMEDITDRRKAEDARYQSEKLAARVLNATSDAVIVINPELEIQFVNTSAQKQLSKNQAIKGKTLSRLLRIRTASPLIRSIQQSYRSLQPSDFEFFWKHGDAWFEIRIRPDTHEISLFMRDISDRKRMHQQLQYAASHDPLTGAPNRTVLFDRLAAYFKSTSPFEQVALMCLDIDFFKDVNDTFGHPVGDTLLKLVVDRLRSCTRSHDLLARTGGDEFMLMQTGVHSRHDVELLADRLVSAMKQPFIIDGREVQVGISLGVALSTIGQQVPSDIYRQADIALYNAKMKKRGGYLFFDPKINEEHASTSELRSDLNGALARGELSLVFQPIIRTMDQTITGAEALLRWQHPRRGNVPPAQFIQLAEESGYINEIGRWVLEEACRTAKSWPDHITISVNVSVKQIEREDFVEFVERALEMNELSNERLQLEVTESVFFLKIRTFSEALKALNERGLRIVLDDFGTGYSSLAYLDSFDFQKIKIDRSFIAKITNASQSMPVLEAIMGVARGLGMTVTAEGIETEAQLEYVKHLGCHEVQGYLLGRPMTAAELIKKFYD